MKGDILRQLEENMLFNGETDYIVTEITDNRFNTYILHNLDGILNDDYVVFYDEENMMPDNSMLRMFMLESVRRIRKFDNDFTIYFKSGEIILVRVKY